MNPYQFPVVCDVCGEGGVARPSDAAAEWYGAKLVHRDPSICRDVLRRRAAALKEQERTGEATSA